MKELFYDLLTIAAIVVFVVDLSGFTASWKRAVARLIHKSPDVIRCHPFDCSLCLTFWVGLVYVIAAGWFDFPAVLMVCVAALLTEPIAGLTQAAIEILKQVANWLFSLSDKMGGGQ